jgi:lipopolysaccharide/colanic/teichoic acid biosynthesis glycosyltransferase
LLAVIGIKLESKGPILYKQKRVGKDFTPFQILKLRSMTNEPREVGKSPIIGKSQGVTFFGYYLRRFKIDELPQIINVLKGDLSLVGPRPSIFEQLEDMTPEEKTRYSVRPGLTGLAQVSGNIYLPWKERYKKDLNYIEHVSFKNDMIILLRTIMVIIIGERRFVNRPITFKK